MIVRRVRVKTLLVVGVVLTAVLSGMYLGAGRLLRSRFLVVEQTRAESESRRVAARLRQDVQDLDSLGRVLATLPAQTPDGPVTAALSRVQYAAEMNAEGEPSSYRGGANAVSPRLPLPAGLVDYLRANQVATRVLAGDAVSGLVWTPEGSLVVSVCPLGTTGGHRVLVLARSVEGESSGVVSSPVWLVPANPADAAEGGERLPDPDRPVSITLAEGCVLTSQGCMDMSGRQALRVMTASRPIGSEQAGAAIQIIALCLVAALLFSTLLTMGLLGRFILNPLRRLSGQLNLISKGERRRVDVGSRDEIGQVAESVNTMLMALEASLARVEEREAWFRSMAEHSPLGVFLCDQTGRTIYQNSRCEATLGQASHDAMGEGWARAIHPADRTRVMASWAHAAQNAMHFREHHRVVRSDGVMLWVTANAAPIVRDGALMGFVGTIEDTTARLQAAEDLRRAKVAAEAASLAKSEFLANMSHEIRTPLTAILGFSDLMLEPGQPEQERQNCLQTVRRNGTHLLAIINDILDLSKIEAGRAVVERVDCEPARVIAEVAGTFGPRARDKGVELSVEFAQPIPARITNDPTKLRQILVNLVSNAVKFTEKGTVRVIAGMTDEASGRRLRVSVVDSGVGLSQDQLSRLFRPFVQGDSSMSRRFGGTGLGLSISQKLANLMGGEITVASEPGRGSTFSVTVDCGAVATGPWIESPLSVDVASPRPEATPPARLAARILLAEDGVDNQRLIIHMLTRAGATVVLAKNGREAVELVTGADKPKFDVILMDMQMPEMDGYTATRVMRDSGYTAPIVALTAHAMAEDRERCLAAGCDDFATKPIDRAALIAKCAQWASVQRRAAA